MNARQRSRIAALAGIATFAASSVDAAVLAVPGDHATLTEACEAAVAGDEIVLAPGTYSAASGESFPLVLDRSLAIRGAGASRTVLDGGGIAAHFTVRDAAVTLEGLTVTRGRAARPGGSVRVEDGTVDLVRVRFTGNEAVGGGDAVAVLAGRVRLVNCLLDRNGRAGSTLLSESGSLTAERCTIAANAGPAVDARGGEVELRGSVIFEPGTQGGSAVGLRLGPGAVLTAEDNLFDACFDGVVEDPASRGGHRIGPRGLRRGAVRFADAAADDYRLVSSPDSGEAPGAFGGATPLAWPPAAEEEGDGGAALLGPSVPNPGRPSSTIHFTVPVATVVDLGIYNVLGQRVRTLVSQHLSAGEHRESWDGRDDAGEELPPGMYFVRVTQGTVTESRRLALVR